MSPFTGDALILEKILKADEIWKELRGPIESIRIFDRTAASPRHPTTRFKVEIRTNESVTQEVDDQGPKVCSGIFQIEANWDFMNLQKVTVKKLEIDFS